MPVPPRDWFASAVITEIGAHLLAAPPDEPLRADDLARKLGRPERSMRELLGRLNSGRLVTRTQLQTGEPGRPPWGYWLTDEQRPAAQRAVDMPEELRESHRKRVPKLPKEDMAVAASDARARTGGLAAPASDDAPNPAPGADASALAGAPPMSGQEVVIVDVSGPDYSHLLEALSGTRTADAANWVIRIGDEMGFVYDSADAASAAADLLAVLAGARLSVRSATLRQVMPAAELIAHAREMAPEIRRARSTRDAHDAPQ